MLTAPDAEFDRERTLLRVTLHEWTANLDHLLYAHSEGSTQVRALYRSDLVAA